jgi:hypothetical protein
MTTATEAESKYDDENFNDNIQESWLPGQKCYKYFYTILFIDKKMH